VRWDHPGQLVPRAIWELRVHRDCRELLERQEVLAESVYLAGPALPDPQEVRDLQDQLVIQDHRADKDRKDFLVHRDHKGPLDQLVQLALQELPDHRAKLDRLVQMDSQVRKELQDNKGLPDLRVIPEVQDFLADLESLDQVVRKDHRALLDLLVIQDQAGQREVQDLLEFPV